VLSEREDTMTHKAWVLGALTTLCSFSLLTGCDDEAARKPQEPPPKAKTGKQERFCGRVELMGRIPDRFDYLHDAARAHAYAAGDATAEHKNEALRKAQEYYQGWKNYGRLEGRRKDFYTRSPELAGHMAQKYRAVLKAHPKHPLKKDLLTAIKELEGVRAKKKQDGPAK
jgi:hypothetical protein